MNRRRSKTFRVVPCGGSNSTRPDRRLRSYDDSDINVLRLLVTESALNAHLDAHLLAQPREATGEVAGRYLYSRSDLDRAQTSGFLWRRAMHHRAGSALNTLDEVEYSKAMDARGLLRCPTCLKVAAVPLFANCGHCFCSENCLSRASPCRSCHAWERGHVSAKVRWRPPSIVTGMVASGVSPTDWSFDLIQASRVRCS